MFVNPSQSNTYDRNNLLPGKTHTAIRQSRYSYPDANVRPSTVLR